MGNIDAGITFGAIGVASIWAGLHTSEGFGSMFTVAGVVFLLLGISAAINGESEPFKGRRNSGPFTLRRIRSEYTPYEFEELVATLLEARGSSATTTSKSGDNGLDVIAREGSEKVGVQVKRYGANSTVGSPAIRDSYAAGVQAGCDRVMVVTSSQFSGPARDAATELSRQGEMGVELVNGSKVVRLLNKHLATDSSPSEQSYVNPSVEKETTVYWERTD